MTIIHEMGHVVMAWLWGRRVSGISLHTDTSGLTVSAGKPTGLGMLFTMLAGYTAPPLTGLALTWATVSGWSGAALTLLVLLFVVAFWLTRNLFGLVTVTIGLATTVGMFGWGSPLAISTYVLAVGLFLVAAGFRGSFDLAAIHQRGEGGESDASQAARLTRLPAMVWVWFFGVVSGLCVVQTLILLTVGLDLR